MLLFETVTDSIKQKIVSYALNVVCCKRRDITDGLASATLAAPPILPPPSAAPTQCTLSPKVDVDELEDVSQGAWIEAVSSVS